MVRSWGRIAVGLLLSVTLGCSLIVDNELEGKGADSGATPDGVGPGDAPPPDGPPDSPGVVVKLDPSVARASDMVVVIVDVKRFKLRPAKIGSADAPGEGHYRLRVRAQDGLMLLEIEEGVPSFSLDLRDLPVFGEMAPVGEHSVEAELVTNSGRPLDPPVMAKAELMICGPETVGDPRCESVGPPPLRPCVPQDLCEPLCPLSPCPPCVRRECTGGAPGGACLAFEELWPVEIPVGLETTIEYAVAVKHTMSGPMTLQFEVARADSATLVHSSAAKAGTESGSFSLSPGTEGPLMLHVILMADDGAGLAEACWPMFVVGGPEPMPTPGTP